MAADKAEATGWETGSGMVDDIEAYISEPFFGIDEKYHPDAVLFQAALVDREGEPLTNIKFSVGGDWTADEDGKEISHPTKDKVNATSRFGYFIERLVGAKGVKSPNSAKVKSPDGEAAGLGLLPVLASRGNSLTAASFEGLGFHWKLHKMETMSKDPESGAFVAKDVLFPVKYLGTWDERAGATPAKKGAAAKTATPAKAAAAASSEDGPDIPAAIRKAMTPLATSSTAKEFIRKAGRDAAVLDLPDETMNYMLNGGPDGFWASVQS